MMDQGLLVCKIRLKSRIIYIRFCTISAALLCRIRIQNNEAKIKKLIVKTQVLQRRDQDDALLVEMIEVQAR